MRIKDSKKEQKKTTMRVFSSLDERSMSKLQFILWNQNPNIPKYAGSSSVQMKRRKPFLDCNGNGHVGLNKAKRRRGRSDQIC